MLDRASPVPLYHQLAEDLRGQIERRSLPPGAALPTEEDLQRIYGVSRATVRQAVRQLSAAGLVRLARPHGTFVTEPRLIEPLPALISFSDEVRRAGLVPSTRVLSAAMEAPPMRVREQLRTGPGELALRVARLRLANGQPIALLTSWLLPSLGIGPDEDFSGSLYQLLAARGVAPRRADQLLDAVSASPRQAALLGVPRRSALLMVSRVTFDDRDRPIEYVEGHYRADRYRYSMRLATAPEAAAAAGGLITV
jgi:GntR family transcriptional regulator